MLAYCKISDMTFQAINHKVSFILLSWVHFVYSLSALLSTPNKHLSCSKEPPPKPICLLPFLLCLLSPSNFHLLPTFLSVRCCENCEHRHLSYCTHGRKRCRTGVRKLFSLTPAFTGCTGRKQAQGF